MLLPLLINAPDMLGGGGGGSGGGATTLEPLNTVRRSVSPSLAGLILVIILAGWHG